MKKELTILIIALLIIANLYQYFQVQEQQAELERTKFQLQMVKNQVRINQNYINGYLNTQN